MNSGAVSCIPRIFLTLIAISVLSGCGLAFEVKHQMRCCAEFDRYEPGMKVNVVPIRPDYFAVDREGSSFCVRTGDTAFYSPKPTAADIPREVIEFGLKEFAGLEKPGVSLKRMARAVRKGIGGTGWVHLYYHMEKDLWIEVMHFQEYRQLSFLVHTVDNYLKPKTYSVDLSDVNVSIPEGGHVVIVEEPDIPAEAVEPEQAREIKPDNEMETELRKARRLRDEGLIDEDEYKQMKERIIEK